MVVVLFRGAGSDWWINPDEGQYYSIATAASSSQVAASILTNAHPPSYYLILREIAAVSTDIAWLRLPALISGVLLIPIGYLLGRRLGGGVAGLVTASLLAFSPAVNVLAQVMRPYTMFLLFLATGLHGLVAYLKERRAAALATYAIGICGAWLLHYSTAVILGGIGLTLLGMLALRKLSPRELAPLALASLPILGSVIFLYIVHLRPYLVGKELHLRAREGPWAVGYPDNLGGALHGLGGTLEYAFGPGLAPAVLALIAASLFFAIRSRDFLPVLLPLATGLVAAILALSGAYPLWGARHCVYMLLIAAPLAGYGFAQLLTVRGRAVAMAAILALAVGGILWRKEPTGLFMAFGSEQFVSLAEAEAVGRFLADKRSSSAVLITDAQTVFLLSPLLGPPAYSRPPPPESVFRTWHSDGRTFVIPRDISVWSIGWRRSELSDPHHLVHLLKALHEDPRWRPRIETEEVWFLQGGWIYNPAWGFGGEAARGRKVLRESIGGRGLGAFRIDLHEYLEYLEEKRAPSAQGS
jgi:4-amino-4-deoxy-L-arabinose transferase-like glycosyltransferase